MLRLALALALITTLSSCVTGERMQSVREGMSKDEVTAILGNPDGFQRSGDDEALRYTNRLISGWSWDRADYNVILRNGRVVAYGAGQVRQRDPNTPMLILVPIK
jgi:ABC-type phosphate transport system ATPase subunit